MVGNQVLAGVLSDQGRYKEAERKHREALQLCETMLEKEHPSTLASMNNLAGVLRDQGKYEEAEIKHREALQLSETVLGKEHPNTLASMNDLAVCAGLEGEGLVAGRYLCWHEGNLIAEDALRFRHVSRTNPWRCHSAMIRLCWCFWITVPR